MDSISGIVSLKGKDFFDFDVGYYLINIFINYFIESDREFL